MADCRLFEEDEVCVSTSEKGILYGLVTQNSEYVSSDEDSDSEDTPQRVKRGTVEVTWHPDGEGKEVILSEKDVCLRFLDLCVCPYVLCFSCHFFYSSLS